MNGLRTFAFALTALALTLGACSSSSSSGGQGGTGGQAPSPGSSTGGATSTADATGSGGGGQSATSGGGQSSASGGGGESTSSGGGGQGPCLEITTSAFRRVIFDGLHGVYEAKVTPDQGGTPSDVLALEFYGAGWDPSLDGDQDGTFDLSTGGNTNYATCSQCVYLRASSNRIDTRVFFQASGTIDVHPDSDTVNGSVDATLTDVTLIEVTFDPNYMTEPVPGGSCVHVSSAEAVRALIPPPPGWTCASQFYGDGQCSCGCGVLDVDCADANVQSCVSCLDTGSCSASACPGDIDPTNNALCN